MDWRCGSNSIAPALQTWSPVPQKRKKKKEENVTWLPSHQHIWWRESGDLLIWKTDQGEAQSSPLGSRNTLVDWGRGTPINSLAKTCQTVHFLVHSYSWLSVQNPQIQPTLDGNFQTRKIMSVLKCTGVFFLSLFPKVSTIIITTYRHWRCIRYYKQSRNDLKCTGGCGRLLQTLWHFI
jgi:hypothetical protein